MKVLCMLLVCSVAALDAAHLQAKYPFSVVLFGEQGQYYELHWNFTRSTESIYFAVNVSTTGWIGFGLSPNGQMPGSDVVIGWVSNGGESYFHDRYAEGRFLPPIDVSQDWFLDSSEEEDGFTILEFSRNFVSCDIARDMEISFTTARLVWSFSVSDPTDPFGSDARQHNYQGTRSINLLGGLPTESKVVSGDEPFFDIRASNVMLPSDPTTYWCTFFKLPQEVIATTSFINRVSPVITPNTRPFVHHTTAYRCHFNLTDDEVGMSVSCADLNERLTECRFGTVLGGWAVGGEDFIYPKGLALAVGGPQDRGDNFIVLETHYDNPGMETGVMDSSGVRFHYTSEEPEQRAGLLFLGHDVRPWMLVPPGLQNYTIAGICSASCTNAFIPEEGIRIFANFFHTHLIGQSVVLEHYRLNPQTDEFEQLEPIDANPSYDFNYQQFNHLPREHIVLRGDVLVTKCIYNSTERDFLTFGGLSTRQEMCLSFPAYYPVAPDGTTLFKCVGNPLLPSSFDVFIGTIQSMGLAQNLTADTTLEEFLQIMAALPWDIDLARLLQDTILDSVQKTFCDTSTIGYINDQMVTLPVADRPFQDPISTRCISPTTTNGALPWMRVSNVFVFHSFFMGVLASIM